MERGYIKLWRKTMDSQHFSMSLKHIGMFDYLLLKANWKIGYFRGRKIEPGQLATSITHLAETVGEHRHTIKRLLDDLQNADMIHRQNVSNRYVLITVCNWELYQSTETAKNPTGVQPESNHVPQSKKGNKGKKNTSFVPPTVDEVAAYCEERENGIDAEQFVSYYEAGGWMRGKTKITNWKECIATWEKNQRNRTRNDDDGMVKL